MSQLQERCIPQLVLTEGFLKHTLVLSGSDAGRNPTWFSPGEQRGRSQDVCQTRSTVTPMRQTPVYLHQNKASPCCKWRSGSATGRQLLKSSESDLWMARGDCILMCRAALVFMKVLFSYLEGLWWLMSKVAALAVKLAELSGWKNEVVKIKIKYLIRGKSRENSSCAGKALRDQCEGHHCLSTWIALSNDGRTRTPPFLVFHCIPEEEGCKEPPQQMLGCPQPEMYT